MYLYSLKPDDCVVNSKWVFKLDESFTIAIYSASHYIKL